MCASPCELSASSRHPLDVPEQQNGLQDAGNDLFPFSQSQVHHQHVDDAHRNEELLVHQSVVEPTVVHAGQHVLNIRVQLSISVQQLCKDVFLLTKHIIQNDGHRSREQRRCADDIADHRRKDVFPRKSTRRLEEAQSTNVRCRVLVVVVHHLGVEEGEKWLCGFTSALTVFKCALSRGIGIDIAVNGAT